MLILASVLSTIVFDPPPAAHVGDLEIVQRVARDHVRTTLAFTLTVEHEEPRELVLALDIARGAAVVGLTLDRVNDEVAVADMLPMFEAARTYQRIVSGRTDPALLEWRSASDAHDRFELRVFPLSTRAPARITIELVTDDPIALQSTLKPAFVYERTNEPRPDTARRAGSKLSLLALEPAIARAFRRAACAGGTAGAASRPCAPSSAPANR